jgi:hypothetical protein
MSRSGKSMDVLTDLLAAVLLSLSIAGNAWAQATKAATASSDLFIVTGPGGTFTTPFSTILSTSIKPPQGSKDLLITVSAATTLLTVDTRSLSTGGAASIDDVGIDVQVLVDGAPVIVGTVPSATFVRWDDQFRFINAVFTTTTFTADDLELFGVRSFTFTQPNVGPGDHLVEVQARYRFLNFDFGPFSSFTEAVVGPRTLVVEGVNLK